ncbi:MAG: hypothetical protein A2X34_02230 [Elusimicrobia bacterium GWC2_51_8]|nr:MAG: hypothetical protein A2X33_05295 [Elusimicrobia bacterium GWA2_51_34]OGR59655.1 MAG: hypothetical protein A2X34_02230 [Elusimicrobia bacterium GWC2_51_8]HAF95995.1 hypothetical protein [Elusimicrobiota bacterium]HCE97008.1 hypothetical protein [Elusimicrobiota bacterium]
MKLIFLLFFAVNTNAATVEDVSKKIGACLQNGQNPTVAVLDFEYINKTDTISPQIIQERLTTALSRSKKVTIVERKLVEKVLKELYFQASGALGPQETAKLGQILNADYILTGTLTDLEKNRVEINARVISVASSTVHCAEKAIISKDWKTSILLPQTPEIGRLPENIKSQVELANLYLENNAPEKSIEIFSSLLNQSSPALDSIKWELYVGRARAYSMNSNSEAALADTENAIALNPNSSQVYALRGLIYSQLSLKHNYAIAEFSQAIKNDPDDQVLYALKGNSELAVGRFHEARRDFEVALSTHPFTSTIRLLPYGLYASSFDRILSAENWLAIGQQHRDLLALSQEDWDYYTDMHVKIALTYALAKDSTTAINYIAINLKELPKKYPYTETIFSIYFSLKNYAKAIKLCTQLELGDLARNSGGQRVPLIEGCSAAYRAVKKYNLAIKTLEPLQNSGAPWEMGCALKNLYLHEAGKGNNAISDIKAYKGTHTPAISLVFAIINFETGKVETAKKFFNLYLKDEIYLAYPDDPNFWSTSEWIKGETGKNVWEYLTEKERNSLTTLSEIVKKEGPILEGKLEAFKKEYFN